MDSNKIGSGLTRRQFLKLGGAAGILAALPHPLYTQASSAVSVGVILPDSQVYPLMAANLLDGLALYFKESGVNVHFLPQQVGVGRVDTLNASEKLLDMGAQLVIGMMSDDTVSMVQSLYEDRRVPLIVATAGENVVRDSSPFVAYNSLGYWQSAWAAGRWAAETWGKRAVVVASFYESGYDALYAFRLGFEANGGSVIDQYITHSPTRANDGLAEALAAARGADVVYAAYSGKEAADFARAYALTEQLPPLIVSPFLAETLKTYTFEGVSSVFSWARGLNVEFDAAFEAATGRCADSFAALGYSSGQLAVRALNFTDVPNLTQPLYLRQARLTSNGIEHWALEQVAAPDEAEVCACLINGSVKTGWSSAYLVG